ncbi:uncharacterized protein LOC135848646 [Planococcus citri]|uniref:uncharacterized protein LOC135848646 n=1 Tax=Planococcus citri TaxID=170843 RepID=UPI0031FA3012
MRFDVSCAAVIFISGVMMKLFVTSDSNQSQSSLDEQDLVSDYTVTDESKPLPNFHQLTNLSPENPNTAVSPSMVSTPQNVSDSSDNHQQVFETQQNYFLDRAQNNEENQKCIPLRPTVVITILPKILSFDIFSQADPAHYLLLKSIKLSDKEARSLRYEVNLALSDKLLPQCYIPFANLLSSFLKCWMFLLNAKYYIVHIRDKRIENFNRYNSLPIEISSSPELSELFSSDVFSDPKPPLRLLNKIFKMSENALINAKNHLQDFLTKWVGTFKTTFVPAYVNYANAVYPVFHDELVLKEFKQDLGEIQRKSNSG